MGFLFKPTFFLIKKTLHHARLQSTFPIPYTMLRPYQKECIQTCLTELEQGVRKQIVSLPVGSGKTVIMSNFIPLIPAPTKRATKVLLLAHRTELLDQAHNQITKYNPDLIVEVEQGSRTANIDKADVIVASVPTLGRKNSKKIDKYDPSQFKAILIDEAHHASAATYLNILDYFGVDDADSKILVWGCSATVKRHDGKSLGDVFDKVTYHADFLKMIEQGYLSSMKVTTVNTNVDLESVGSTKLDFKQGELADAVNTDVRNDVIVSSWRKYAHENGRKATLAFAVDINHTEELCNTFRDAGINASFITSKTPPLERHGILNDFRNGKIPVLVNCAILTEGTDIPCVDCILLARPTKSNTLFQQMFGRGLRLYEGKKDCLLIDFVDNFKRSGPDGLVTVPTLLGLSTKDMVIDQDILALESKANSQYEEKEKVTAEKAQEKQDLESDLSAVHIRITEYDTLDELIADLSGSPTLRKASHNGWVDVGEDKCVLHIPNQGYLMLTREKGLWTGSFRYDTKDFRAKSFEIPLTATDVSSAVRAGDTWVQTKFGTGNGLPYQLSRNASYRKDVATEAQLRALKRYKIVTQDKMTKGQAMDLLTKLKFGQLKIWKAQHKMGMMEKKMEEKVQKAAVLSRRRRSSSLSDDQIVPVL